MPQITVLHWDEGRLRVNAAFATWLESLGLTAAEKLAQLDDGTVYRRVGERVTSQIELATASEHRTVFLKRHGRLTWRERWKAWCRLQPAVWGARPEWDAILEFHRLGLPTMTPIASGEWRGRSYLLTDALQDCERLDHWLAAAHSSPDAAIRRAVAERLADLARRLHAAGWHHQDLYLCHILWSREVTLDQMHIIDLGRVQPHGRMAARRWIVKDLAQLNYSANGASRTDRLRFLQAYLGRNVTASDKPLVRSILRKSERIARHSKKNGL